MARVMVQPFRLGVKVPGFGTIKSIRFSQGQRDYLLKDEREVVSWLDEQAIVGAFEYESGKTMTQLVCPHCRNVCYSNQVMRHENGCIDRGMF